MGKIWKITSEKNKRKYFILKDESIWITNLDESGISIEDALREKNLYETTTVIRFSNLDNIIFNEEKFGIHFNFVKEINEKQEKGICVNVPENYFFQIRNELESKFEKTVSLNDLSLVDRFSKPMVLSIISTIGIGLFLILSYGLSIITVLLLLAITAVEIFVFTRSSNIPKRGKILKLN